MRIRSPIDLRSIVPGERLRIGGRVVRSGETVHLTDACASVALPGDIALDDGALAILDATAQDGELGDCELVWTGAGAPGADVARFRDGGVGATLALRARATSALRAWFAGEGFVELETPALVPCPGLDVHLDAFEALDASAAGPPRPLRVGRRMLATSPEYQMKRALVGGLPRTFQLARAFRAGEVGEHHNPEFTMLEWYRAFAGMDDVIGDTEAVITTVFSAVGPASPSLDLGRPFERISVSEAFERFAHATEAEMLRLAHEDEERFFRLLVDEIEPRLAERRAPVVLHRYPAKMASLARLCPHDERFAERFEVYAGGIELSNGFGELTDPLEQRARFARDQAERRNLEKNEYAVDERFLASLAEGMPPSAGNALGFDRLLMLALGKRSIRDVLALPEGVL
ncbi:MAG TPA: EF-P lysine aminoacylase EpmA [Polyangiaceae bacterium]|nr:EF-P lysine aminoacylase EpmA [Polyangiaceae bacterium]